jgi:hypothetical protein
MKVASLFSGIGGLDLGWGTESSTSTLTRLLFPSRLFSPQHQSARASPPPP